MNPEGPCIKYFPSPFKCLLQELHKILGGKIRDIPEKYFPLDAVGGEQQLELNPPRPYLCDHHCKKQVTSSAGEGAGGIPVEGRQRRRSQKCSPETSPLYPKVTTFYLQKDGHQSTT